MKGEEGFLDRLDSGIRDDMEDFQGMGGRFDATQRGHRALNEGKLDEVVCGFEGVEGGDLREGDFDLLEGDDEVFAASNVD